jgi:hypothetical protein
VIILDFNHQLTARTTRQSNLLHLPRVRTEMAKKSFHYKGAKVFKSALDTFNLSMDLT